MSNKRLSKSNDKVLLGVCGGIAEFISWPTQTVRILWVILTVFGGLGVFGYLIMALVMPSSGEDNFNIDNYRKE